MHVGVRGMRLFQPRFSTVAYSPKGSLLWGILSQIIPFIPEKETLHSTTEVFRTAWVWDSEQMASVLAAPDTNAQKTEKHALMTGCFHYSIGA